PIHVYLVPTRVPQPVSHASAHARLVTQTIGTEQLKPSFSSVSHGPVSFTRGSAAGQLPGSGVEGVVAGQGREGVSKRSALPQAGLSRAQRIARTPRHERPRTGIWAGDHPSRCGLWYDNSGSLVEVADYSLVLC